MTKPITITRTANSRGRRCSALSETVARMDAGIEPTWMYSRRVSDKVEHLLPRTHNTQLFPINNKSRRIH